jgi:large subunit ribosomal protein L10
MNREDKNQAIEDLAQQLSQNNVVYLADVAEMTVENSNKLRRLCFNREVSLKVVKNTLLRKAMEKVEDKDFSEMYDVLKGNTSIMFSEVGNAPAKLIKEFRKKQDKPVLKAAYVEEAIFIGDDKLDALTELKSKEELIGDVIMLLQSPIKNVVSGVSSSAGGNIAGLLKALEERNVA